MRTQVIPVRRRWRQRQTVRALKQEPLDELESLRLLDERENEETRPPDEEEIHLGGLVLTEAFTPSTVAGLYKSLEGWPSSHGEGNEEYLTQLERSRAGAGGGWVNLDVVRPEGAVVIGPAHTDSHLPLGIEAAWVHVSYVTPALAMVVGTFTLAEDAGDLTALLRRDYQSAVFDVCLRVPGRCGELRKHIPWARPARYTIGSSIGYPEQQKQAACDEFMRVCQDACGRWFAAKFPGCFSADPDRRPVIRMLFTNKHEPFAEKLPWLRPVGLDFARPLWRSTHSKGWWLSAAQPPYCRPFVMTLAARRADAAKSPGGGFSGESNWFLTQRFGTKHASLAARHAMLALLSLYGHRLGRLRDRAGVKRFPRRPVREARVLDNYLIRDGLDAVTVTADLDAFTEDLGRFRRNVPEFIEDRTALPQQLQRNPPIEYVPQMRTAIREQAARLARDTATTTGTMRASAELRQAIANTMLQRSVVLLAVVAIIVAVISLLTAMH